MPRRLQFADPGIEATYRRWRSEQAAPLVRAGMILLLIGGLTIVVTGQIGDQEFGEVFVGLNLAVIPGFLVSILVASRAPVSRWLLPVAAVAAAWWGAALLWTLHRSLDAPGLGTTAVLLVGLWALVVLRLPPGLALPTCLAPAVIHQIGLILSAEDAAGTDLLHSTVTWLVLVAGVAISIFVDRSLRTQFAQEATIAAQRDVIERERQRADELLQNILPEAIARRLKDGAHPIADHHDGVTVLFADVVGFTALSTRLPAAKVVELLDEVFHRIDDIVDRHGVEKIRTVGDAYMAVAGAPKARPDHTEAIAEVALDIVAALEAMAGETATPIEMRVGIATGDAVAGVIGRKKFAYDLWSDTVNTAARMESHGVPGRIQITAATASRLERAYVVEERGVIDVKGKGPTPTWFLVGRREAPPSTGQPDSDAAAVAG